MTRPPAYPRRPLLAATLGALVARPIRAKAAAETILDDASRLNPTPIARHIIVPPGRDATILASLRRALRDAAAAGRPVALGAARHSLGGQSLAAHGTAFTFAPGGCEPDSAAGTFRATAGTRWRDVIAALDPLGFSPAVMQSNQDFGVASTFSVNAHGWPVPHGPFGSTVRSIRLLLADGQVVRCSPTENAGLFALAMGGYGLFGIILELEAGMVPNQLLQPHFQRMPSDAFASRFVELCLRPDITMAYGRLNIAAKGFLEEALMIGFSPAAAPASLPPAPTGSTLSFVSRQVYRAQTGSEAMKQARWVIETELGPRFLEGPATRNALLNEPVSNLAGGDPARTDILHEYFLPPTAFPGYIAACRAVLPAFRQELLNVTLRLVEPDTISRLAYAPGRRIGAVISFSQRMAPADEADMRAMTQALVERIIALGGSFYLPYRLHARPSQVARAYPALHDVAAAKRRHDPGLLFRNALWDTWLSKA